MEPYCTFLRGNGGRSQILGNHTTPLPVARLDSGELPRSLVDSDSSNAAELLVYLPIVIFLMVLCLFFLGLVARFSLRRFRENHPLSRTKIAAVTLDKDEVIGDTVKENSGEEHAENGNVTPKKVAHRLPPGLVNLMLQQQEMRVRLDVPIEYKGIIDRWVKKYSDSNRTSDSEALEMFDMISGLLDTRSCLIAASSLHDRGFASSALSLLALSDSDELVDFKRHLQNAQEEERKKSKGALLIHYGKFWRGIELRNAVLECYHSLKQILKETSHANPDPTGAFGIQGLMKDFNGALTNEEQLKFRTLQDAVNADGVQIPPPVTDIFQTNSPPISTDLPKNKKIFMGPSFKLPLVRFVKVESILRMHSLTKCHDLPDNSFTKIGKFAISYCWESSTEADPSGAILDRLKHVLRTIPGIEENDDVYIDWCCFHEEDATRLLVTKSIFQHCHVIFLPSSDYFLRSWCTYEYFSWLLSPFPNQALGDYDMSPAASHLSVFFGRQPFLLDRPELSCFGYRCMASTDTFDPRDKAFLMNKIVTECTFYQSSLEELLTKIVFKLEYNVVSFGGILKENRDD
jgi:hypothetical protein